jgi:putative lipoic acid-binding regulatory protein
MPEPEIKFPITYSIKVVMINNKKENLEKILISLFEQLNIPFSVLASKLSSADKYISYTSKLKIEDRSTYNQLYEELTNMPQVKFAI